MSSSNSSPSNSRRGPRGGGGRGRGRGGGRRSGRGRSNKRSTDRGNNNSGSAPSNSSGSNSDGGSQPFPSMPGMRDEEVLIAFMPYLKGDNLEAMAIHESYQSNNDQQAFLKAARDFLAKDTQSNGTPSRLSDSSTSPGTNTPETNQPSTTPPNHTLQRESDLAGNGGIPSNPFAPGHSTSDSQRNRSFDNMDALEREMRGLIGDDDPVIEMPGLTPSRTPAAIGDDRIGSSPANRSIGSSRHDNSQTPQRNIFGQPQSPSPFDQFAPQPGRQPITPPRQGFESQAGQGKAVSSSPFPSLFPSSQTNEESPFSQNPAQGVYSPSQPSETWKTQPSPLPGLRNNSGMPTPDRSSDSFPQMPTPSTTDMIESGTTDNATTAPAETPKPPAKKEYQPKRLWTHLDEQPGKILANNLAAAIGSVLDLHPREELKAKWMLPLSYLHKHAAGRDDLTSIRDLLDSLAVGLFRRGCTENGTQASIVSKEILTPAGESRADYPFQVVNDAVVGTVPFFSPRTPGHVVFRLYWQDQPLYTLATGPTLNVRVTDKDFESSIRFILSNFKAKKVNPTSLSSLNSLSLVLEQFQIPSDIPQQRVAQQLESAGRAVWGCICEARKVLDACASEYQKTISKLQKLEDAVDDLKAEVEQEQKSSGRSDNKSSEGVDQEDEHSENAAALREKQRTLMSGRASCERKWRDSQLAFASILKAVVTNSSISAILRREHISKLRLEYGLWCPLSEEFAVPGDSDSKKMWYEPLNNIPHTITSDHIRMCMEARSKMQHRSLGFDPNTTKLETILYPNRGRSRQMNPAAVNVFNQLSAAMGKLYQENYATADHVFRQREMIRAQTESFVSICDCFPPGTKVAIFGSSANGFGSPKSDLDMCLQIPPGQVIADEDDPSGSSKMAKLAKILEQNGMQDVDTARLTARIPVIKFNCPTPLHDASEGEDAFMECDLSMHNPLAVLNTSLLRTYAEINPVPRVLAGVIKRWAKARDINNPARHTLSSYGYIIMLLHFLTFHQRTGNGLVAAASSKVEKGSPGQNLPLLPNLQWMDASWPEMQPGTPYTEHRTLPKKPLQHPLEENAAVNSYFYSPNAAMLQNLQRLFPGQDLSLGILLASFFRYYAYEFDYKRYVVSLHSNLTHGLIEREVKAELDGWRNYSAALTIEDPFETFYDVAHVLRGGYYHRIRREFAVAYSKIADVASGKTSSTWNNRSVDLTKMIGMELIDWICEPVATDRDDASSQR